MSGSGLVVLASMSVNAFYAKGVSMLKKILLSTLIIIVLLCLGGGLYLYRLVNRDIDESFCGNLHRI